MNTLSRLAVPAVFSTILAAQSPGPYGVGPAWWNAGQGDLLPWEESYENPDGQVSILNKLGAVHTAGHPFFESLGENHRACVTCHQPSNGMSLSLATIAQRWTETAGRDPLFAAVDGANCPDLPQSAQASHSLLLHRGLFRISLPWPPENVRPDFQIEVVRDSTGCNLSPIYGLKSAKPRISVFRRPRIAANLQYVATLMADGREPSLESQARNEALEHEQAAAPPNPAQLRRIADFERQIYAAQGSDIRGGLLDEKGGPLALGAENLASGAAVFEDRPDSPVLLSFRVWEKHSGEGDLGLQREFRASVARGSTLFFTRAFRDPAGAATYTCASCHNRAAPGWSDIGTTNTAPEQASPDLPLFRITCAAAAPPHPTLGRVFYSQDPGRALISGRCADAGAIVPQQLRALAARAPYFTNGSARTLGELVDFYDRRFKIGYTEQEKHDLINFLRAL